ncbi:hypothetical protein VN12_26655 [Pirellula sp. SH-Sr6A]|uniref:hypothetical protein n=1 Tax=Pirellula sp. SH-Sr6A TaxID=1632865 RepID=UPI00078CDCFC|nr:hypothetical protein [Pirellula sp. SH-Sr6A]AMV35702.1 hypothetical protein VN12_26655 [Pirellula sp. SH-Sr6A]
MTVDQLIERLTEYRDAMGGEVEVRLMTQEKWPFENRIVGLVSAEEMNEACDEDDEDYEDDESDDEVENMVYIVEGGQICYGSKRAWEAAH